MNNMSDLLAFFELSNKLKETNRWGECPQIKEKESSADHSWHLMLMLYVANHEMNLNLDLLKAFKLALLHDLAEAVCGDTDSSLVHQGIVTKEMKQKKEHEALEIIIKNLSGDFKDEINEIMHDYENGISEEAKIVKALDKIESIVHIYFLGKEKFDHPDWIAPHPNAAVKKAPALKPFLKELHQKLKPAYKELGWEWRDEYNDY